MHDTTLAIIWSKIKKKSGVKEISSYFSKLIVHDVNFISGNGSGSL